MKRINEPETINKNQNPEPDLFSWPQNGGISERELLLRSRKEHGRRVRQFAAFAVIISAALLLFIFTYLLEIGKDSNESKTGSESSLEIQNLIERGQQLINQKGAGVWAAQILAGEHGLDDYLQRLFTSPWYLMKATDDNEFIRDSYQVVYGEPISSLQAAEAARLLQTQGSRLAWLRQLTSEAGLAADSKPLISSPTSLRTIVMASDLPEQNARVIGVLPVTAELRLTGENARVKLFSDGFLQQSYDYALLSRQAETTGYSGNQNAGAQNPDKTENEHLITIYWDTRFETPGAHKLDYLIQTSDGRGVWVSLDSFVVPEVSTLASGQLSAQMLKPLSEADEDPELSDSMELWCRMESLDNLPKLTLFQSDADLELTMFNIFGAERAASRVRFNQPAALRYRGDQSDLLPLSLQADQNYSDSTSYYVRIRRAADAGDQQIHFGLTAAETVAVTKEAPQRFLPVLAIEDNEITIADDSGQAVIRPLSEFDLLNPDGRLAGLYLFDENGSSIDFAPVFDRETNLYGLYVPEDTDVFSFDAWTIEGSAAELEIEMLYEDGSSLSPAAREPISLQPSVNRLRFLITGFSGQTRTYELAVLRSPAADGYHNVLEAFPLSYRTPLWSIHLSYPNWQFLADQTGIDWQEFLAAQDNRDKNLVDANYSPGHWVKPDSPVYDGASWKAASREVIEYFGDPRHALNELDLFQFESLLYEADLHTLNGIESMLQDTFMQKGSSEIDYAPLILEAGRQADLSPFFIAAKILQEMGPQGQSMLAYGTLPGYEGVYNFYNIGSTPDPSVENGALINGARFALYGKDSSVTEPDEEEQGWLIPWNTPERAIIGGAIWISERYVAIGQDTLFGQKFDLVADPDLFIRQYAQNIQMAWAEGRRTYRAYQKLDLLNQPFVFKIPVFDNIPAQTPVWP